MGDKSAARGSVIILRIAEMDIFNSLSQHKVLKTITRYTYGFVTIYQYTYLEPLVTF